MVSLWVFVEMCSSQTGALFTVMKKAGFAILLCSVALGAAVGIITGVIKGRVTETGFFGGAKIEAMAGAITAIQLMEVLMVHGEPFPKVALLRSLLREGLRGMVHTCITATETDSLSITDIYEIAGTRGLSQDSIKTLPTCIFHSSCKPMRPGPEISRCIICLEDFENGDITRKLPSCRHSFHFQCIDEWLILHGCCPICRENVFDI